MKVVIPEEKTLPTIEYLGKKYKVSSMKLGDAVMFDSKGKDTSMEQVVLFLSQRLPEMTQKQVENIPAHHIKPIIDAIASVYKLSAEKKSTTE